MKGKGWSGYASFHRNQQIKFGREYIGPLVAIIYYVHKNQKSGWVKTISSRFGPLPNIYKTNKQGSKYMICKPNIWPCGVLPN